MHLRLSQFSEAVAVVTTGAVALLSISLGLIGFPATRLMGEELLFGSSVLVVLAAAGLFVLSSELRASSDAEISSCSRWRNRGEGRH